ncbi:RICIN domain-containing protein [Umezawaea beigongshangensis]|uniref:RICIN domain-containing protein n=1 Tax=Umezawaea beigongshangensis TaxID=2780383 RepID=UPI0018F1DDF4|nr:RICIN domain-containing protein [Umezawaea beigongshangensis]
MKKQFTRLAVVAAVGFLAASGAFSASASAGAPTTGTVDDPRLSTVGEVLAKTAKAEPGAESQQRSADVEASAAITIMLQNVNSGRCFDVVNGSTANGTDVQQYECAEVRQQHLTLLTPELEWTSIQFKHSGKCLDVRGAGLSNGTQLQQWDCASGIAAQQFAFFEQSNGALALVSRTAWEGNAFHTKCVDVRGAGIENGAKIQQWGCGTTRDDNEDVVAAQQFNAFSV